MQDALYEFLILNRKLSLPGVGTICLKQNAAKLDFGNKQFTPPSYFFALETERDQPSKKMFEWLATSRNISEWDAVKAINEFSFSLKDKIASAGTMSWDNVGIFSRDEKGSLMLESSPLSFETPVAAEKVIREKAEHTVMVGVEEKTVAEMEEYFAEDTTKRDYGWVIAVILAVISVMFVGWYFSQNGFLPSSAGNKTFIKSN
jgi:nitrogen regulatory protein PII-like uncharacterized protein